MVFRRSLIASLSVHALAMAGAIWISFGVSNPSEPRLGLEVGLLETAAAEPEPLLEPLPDPEPPAREDDAPLPSDVPYEEAPLAWEPDPPLQAPLADTRFLQRMSNKPLQPQRAPAADSLALPSADAASPAPATASAPPTAASPAAPVSASPLEAPPPTYPRASLRLGEEGTVRLSIEVAADGLVLSVSILESSGYPRLDNAAREAVLGWRFSPATRGGEPVEDRVVHLVTFRIT